jgi:hypothetical protein
MNVSSFLTSTSVVPFWVRWLPYLLAAAAAGGWLWQYTAGVKAKTTAEVDARWERRLDDFDRLARKRVDEIWSQSSNFANNADIASKRQSEQVQSAMKVIKATAQAGEYLELKEGRCVFKPEYVESFNALRATLPGASK